MSLSSRIRTLTSALALGAVLAAAAWPAEAEAARFTGTTNQGRAMTVVTSGDEVVYFRALWDVRCAAVGRTLSPLFVNYSRDRAGAVPIPVRDGRFRFSASPGAGPIDAAGTHGRVAIELGGRIAGRRAGGYLLLSLQLLGRDGRTVVDTCHTGPLRWSLRAAG